MQTLVLSLVLSLLTYINVTAQSTYDGEMSRAFELWQKNQSEEAANLFERIAFAEEENWLPFYYAAQVRIVRSFPMTNAVQKEQLLKDAQLMLDKAENLGGDEVELIVLQAMLHTATLTIDPSVYGMKLSPVISGLYAEATKISPENPRLLLSKAEWNMGTAKYFGENPSKFCPDLQASLRFFEEEDHSPLIAPAWGEERLHMLIAENCNN